MFEKTVLKKELEQKANGLSREIDTRFNEEMIRFKFRADEMMSHMVNENKFKEALGRTVNRKDYELLYD